MELTLNRIVKDKPYTLGKLLVDGKECCYTLEPKWRKRKAKKVPGRTAIPRRALSGGDNPLTQVQAMASAAAACP